MDLVQIPKDKVRLLNDLVSKEKEIAEFCADEELQFSKYTQQEEFKKDLEIYQGALEFIFEAIAIVEAHDISSLDEEETKNFVCQREYAAQLVALENNYLAQKILLARNHNTSLSVH